jgi:hypothetical protein
MEYVERIRLLLPMLKGNLQAAEFVAQVIDCLHVWDDLIDRDKPVSDIAINDTFYKLLVLIPQNEFYQTHFRHLNPIIVNAITNWHVANRLEAEGSEYQTRIAYILRSTYVDLTTQCALLIGGVAHAVEVGLANRLFTHKETYEGYLKNLEIEQRTRNGELRKE